MRFGTENGLCGAGLAAEMPQSATRGGLPFGAENAACFVPAPRASRPWTDRVSGPRLLNPELPSGYESSSGAERRGAGPIRGAGLALTTTLHRRVAVSPQLLAVVHSKVERPNGNRPPWAIKWPIGLPPS